MFYKKVHMTVLCVRLAKCVTLTAGNGQGQFMVKVTALQLRSVLMDEDAE